MRGSKPFRTATVAKRAPSWAVQVWLPLVFLLTSPSLRSTLALQAGPTATLSPAREGAGGHRRSRVLVVVSRTDVDGENTEWLQQLVSVPYLTFTERTLDSRSLEHPGYKTKPLTERGGSTRECGGILSFIVEYYDRLPDVAVFTHALHNGTSDHSDPHMLRAISKMAEAPERVGYCSLNKIYSDWRPAMNRAWSSLWHPAWQDFLAAAPASGELRKVLPATIPEAGTSCWCCGQFAVSRERIRIHPRAFYEELLAVVMKDPGLNPSERPWERSLGGRRRWVNVPRNNGRCMLLETVWHVLFGEPSNCSFERGMCRAVYEGESAVAAEVILAG